MPTYDLSNLGKIDYLPSYYKGSDLIKLIYRNYVSIGITKSNLNSNIYAFDYIPIDNYQISLIQLSGSTNSNPLWAYVVYDSDGNIFSNFDSLDYDIYFTITAFNASNSSYYSTTTYLQQDMVVNGVIPMSFPLTVYNGANSISITSLTLSKLEIGYVMKESAVHSYMSELINYQYEKGYEQGYFDSTSEHANPIYNGVPLIGELFSQMGGLLNYEIMPNVSIGGLISIPLVLTGIVLIIKAIK